MASEMIRYRLRVPEIDLDPASSDIVEVILRTNEPEEEVAIEYLGDPDAVEQAREVLSSAYGFLGHLIGDFATAIDLEIAMAGQYLKKFSPQLLEGADVLAKP